MPERVNKVTEHEPYDVPIEAGTIVTDRCNHYIVAEFNTHGASIHGCQFTAISLTDGHFFCFPVNSLKELKHELRDLSVLPRGQQIVITHKEYKG